MYQARRVLIVLRDAGMNASLQIIQTTGDKVQDRFLFEIGGKGLFIREIETALKEGRIDIGVHSLKDLPASLDSEFAIAAFLKRESACDVFVQNPGFPRQFAESKKPLTADDFKKVQGLKIATGSLRRRELFESLGVGHVVEGIRGNVDTRILKLQRSEWDGLVLAQVSIERLKMAERRYARVLDPEWFVPSPGQGVIAVECLAESPVFDTVKKAMDDPDTRAMSMLERGVLSDLGGDCRMPIGAHAKMHDGGNWTFNGLVLAPEHPQVRVSHSGSVSDLKAARKSIYEKFIDANVNEAFKKLGIEAIPNAYPGS